MIEVNLVPDVKQELIRAQRTRTFVISVAIVTGIIAVAIVVILAVWVFAVQSIRQTAADDAIKKGDATLQANADLSKILTIQNQLKTLGELNDGKTNYSRIFDVLASILPEPPDDIRISDLGIDDATKTITIQGQAANSYPALELFKKTIVATNITYGEGDNVQTVPLAKVVNTSDVSFALDSSGNTVLRFTLSFEYPEELFLPVGTNLKFTRASEGNVTDSYLDLPQSLFTDAAKPEGAN